jgi:hypothetical protein
MASEPTQSKFTAPYASFRTFDNLIGRMAEDGGVPGRVDRSYLKNLPGSAQSEIQTTMKALGFIDDGFHPTPLLGALIEGIEAGTAPETMRAILESKYPAVLELGMNATQSQLVDAFRELNVSGSTLRKAIRFFLGAADFAGITVSPHFKAPPVDPAERRQRKPKAPAKTDPKPPADRKPPGGGSFSTSVDLHPFIAGLVGSLPEPGSHFPEELQDAWFDTARGIFRLIYAPTPDRAKPGGTTAFLDLSEADVSETGGDDD